MSHSPGAVNTFQFRAKLAPSPEDQAHVLHFTPTARAGRRSHDTRDLRISEPALGFRLARLRDAFSRVGMRKIPPTLPGGSEPGWNSSRGFKKLQSSLSLPSLGRSPPKITVSGYSCPSLFPSLFPKDRNLCFTGLGLTLKTQHPFIIVVIIIIHPLPTDFKQMKFQLVPPPLND